MKKLIFILLALSLTSCGSDKVANNSSGTSGSEGLNIASVQSARNTGEREIIVGGEILVKFKSDITVSETSKIHQAYRTTSVGRVNLVPGLEHVKLPESMSVDEAVARFSSDPNVEYAEPNFIYSADSTIPNDVYFDRQWSLRNMGIIADGTPGADIRATDAWDITTGAGSIVVAILDTGIDYDHFDLVDNIWTNPLENPNNGIDDDMNGYIDDWRGWDFTTCDAFSSSPPFGCTIASAEDNDPYDDHGHGTHVAGTVGATGNNGEGVTGVMWEVQLMALKVLNADGFGTTADIINAMDYAVANGASIMNASLGGVGFSQAMYDAISAANTAGVLLVAAAGNESNNTDINPHYPSSYDLPNIISVAATDQNDLRVSFSNFGINSVDVAAPGTYIFSTVPFWWEGFAGFGTLDFNSGTSMSTPHVSGLAGLLYSYYPHFTHSQVRGTIMRYVDVLPTLQGWIQSNGRINTYSALSSLLTPSGLSAEYTSSITLRWTDNALGEDGYQIERSVSGGGFADIASIGPNSTMYTDSGVNPSNTYSYRVMATNTIPAESSPSNVAVVPAAPSNLSALRISDERIDLSWSDNSTNESGFKIERKRRSEDNLGNVVESDFKEIVTVMANVTSYRDDDLVRGTYFYRVRAFTETGLSAYSNEASESASKRRSGSGGCSIGASQNTPSALANGAMLLLPLIFIALMRLKRRSRILSSDIRN